MERLRDLGLEIRAWGFGILGLKLQGRSGIRAWGLGPRVQKVWVLVLGLKKYLYGSRQGLGLRANVS